jgi:hypothetical protein
MVSKVHTPDPGDEHPGRPASSAGALLNSGTTTGLEASSTRTEHVIGAGACWCGYFKEHHQAGGLTHPQTASLLEVYRSALGRILNLAQEDEGGDMIEPILQTVRLALDEGITYETWSENQRLQRMAGIDLSGRPA